MQAQCSRLVSSSYARSSCIHDIATLLFSHLWEVNSSKKHSCYTGMPWEMISTATNKQITHCTTLSPDVHPNLLLTAKFPPQIFKGFGGEFCLAPHYLDFCYQSWFNLYIHTQWKGREGMFQPHPLFLRPRCHCRSTPLGIGLQNHVGLMKIKKKSPAKKCQKGIASYSQQTSL